MPPEDPQEQTPFTKAHRTFRYATVAAGIVAFLALLWRLGITPTALVLGVVVGLSFMFAFVTVSIANRAKNQHFRTGVLVLVWALAILFVSSLLLLMSSSLLNTPPRLRSLSESEIRSTADSYSDTERIEELQEGVHKLRNQPAVEVVPEQIPPQADLRDETAPLNHIEQDLANKSVRDVERTLEKASSSVKSMFQSSSNSYVLGGPREASTRAPGLTKRIEAAPNTGDSNAETERAIIYRDASSAPEVPRSPEENSTTWAARPSLTSRGPLASTRKWAGRAPASADQSDPQQTNSTPSDVEDAKLSGEGSGDQQEPDAPSGPIWRTPRLKCDTAEPIPAGTVFNIEVSLDKRAAPETPDIATGPKFKLDPQIPEEPDFEVVVYLVLSEQLRIPRKALDHKVLKITRGMSESPRALFQVRVEDTNNGGPAEVTALYYHRGYPCGRVQKSIDLAPPEGEKIASHRLTIVDAPAPQSTESPTPPDNQSITDVPAIFHTDGPDMTVTVVRSDVDPERYQYFLLIRTQDLKSGKVTQESSGVKTWRKKEPEKFVAQEYARFSESLGPTLARAALRTAGVDFFKIAPEDFRTRLVKLIKEGKGPKTILLFSDEPHVPWELMIPPLPEMTPLGVRCAIGRWTSDPQEQLVAPARQISTKKALVWAPAYSTPLKNSVPEQKFVSEKFGGGDPIAPSTFEGLCNGLSTATSDTFLHFICHGTSDIGLGSDQAIIGLSDPPLGEGIPGDDKANGRRSKQVGTIFAHEFAGDDRFVKFCAGHPLIFLNACKVGGGVRTLTSLGGFGPTFIKLQAGAVVAPLWSVYDDYAKDVATLFYDRLDEEPATPLAKIVQGIRAKAYETQQEDGLLTYAAYCFYGDPLATSLTPKAIPSESNSPHAILPEVSPTPNPEQP